MVKANGKIEKQTYCTNCFSIITWNTTKDQHNFSGHRMIVCPFCRAKVNIDDSNISYIETGVIENPKAYINGVAYATSAEAISDLKPGDTLSLMEDVSINTLELDGANLDLNGHTLTVANAIYPTGTVVLSNGTITTSGNTDSIVAEKGVEVTLNKVVITSKRNGVDAMGGKLILNNASITAQEAAILALDGGSVEINGGTYTTVDNGPIMTNGTDGRGGNIIIVNDGVFTGHITSAGYLAFVAYLANSDSLIINGGTFNVENGSAFVVRGGYLNINPNAIISTSGSASGKVGDGSQIVPAGYDVVIDYKSKYPAVDTINVVAPGRNIHTINAE